MPMERLRWDQHEGPVAESHTQEGCPIPHHSLPRPMCQTPVLSLPWQMWVEATRAISILFTSHKDRQWLFSSLFNFPVIIYLHSTLQAPSVSHRFPPDISPAWQFFINFIVSFTTKATCRGSSRSFCSKRRWKCSFSARFTYFKGDWWVLLNMCVHREESQAVNVGLISWAPFK